MRRLERESAEGPEQLDAYVLALSRAKGITYAEACRKALGWAPGDVPLRRLNKRGAPWHLALPHRGREVLCKPTPGTELSWAPPDVARGLFELGRRLRGSRGCGSCGHAMRAQDVGDLLKLAVRKATPPAELPGAARVRRGRRAKEPFAPLYRSRRGVWHVEGLDPKCSLPAGAALEPVPVAEARRLFTEPEATLRGGSACRWCVRRLVAEGWAAVARTGRSS